MSLVKLYKNQIFRQEENAPHDWEEKNSLPYQKKKKVLNTILCLSYVFRSQKAIKAMQLIKCLTIPGLI